STPMPPPSCGSSPLPRPSTTWKASASGRMRCAAALPISGRAASTRCAWPGARSGPANSPPAATTTWRSSTKRSPAWRSRWPTMWLRCALRIRLRAEPPRCRGRPDGRGDALARGRVGGAIGAALQPAHLGVLEPFHLAQVRFGELQGGVDPDFAHLLEFGEGEGAEPPAHRGQCAVRAVVPTTLCDVLVHRLFALAVFGEHVDETHLVQFGGAIDAAAQHHLLGPSRIELARQQAVGAHAGEQVEQDLRQTELGTL